MQIKRQKMQKKTYQTVLFCNFQQLKPSYFAYFATINCTAPAVEDHTDSIVLDGRGTSKNTGLLKLHLFRTILLFALFFACFRFISSVLH